MEKKYFSIIEFNKLKENQDWKFGNNILYDLCKNYPNHNEKAVVIAKVWLIGRSYAASIERGAKWMSLGTNGFYSRVGNTLVQFNKSYKFDDKIKDLKEMDFGKESIKKTLRFHKDLVDLINQELTKKNNRSFVSKYLHFHSKNVPLYDSITKEAISKMPKALKNKAKTIKNELKIINSDEEYLDFCSKFLVLHEFICQELKVNPKQITTRNIDYYLSLKKE